VITYVAIPYTDVDEKIREYRFDLVNLYMARLAKEGVVAFSPISMMHPVALHGLPTDWEYWKKFDTEFLRVCSDMHVICAPGWEESVGVQAEIKIMEEFGKPIEYIKALGILFKDGHNV